MAQTALWFGVDDLDGTVQEEKIYHMAGTETPESMTTADLQRLIRAAGRDPSSATRSTTSSDVQVTPKVHVRQVRQVRRAGALNPDRTNAPRHLAA